MHLENLLERASRCISGGHSLDGLALLRQHRPSSYDASLYEPVLCLILQGRKQVSIGPRSLSFGPGECLLVSHDLPVRSRITKAPYLALVFQVHVPTLRTVYGDVAELAPDDDARVAETHRADPGLLDALGRFMALAGSPSDAKVLAPLVSKEIHYRLLVAPFGGMLRRLVRLDSKESAIARAMGYLREDIQAALAIPELARRVGMSASSFHKHFKAIAKTSPLQYQKALRLLEARRLLKLGGASVTAIAFDVGYESPTQFSREYARKFGVPPSRDLSHELSSSVARGPRA